MIKLIVVSFITGLALGIGFAIPIIVYLWLIRKKRLI